MQPMNFKYRNTIKNNNSKIPRHQVKNLRDKSKRILEFLIVIPKKLPPLSRIYSILEQKSNRGEMPDRGRSKSQRNPQRS